MSFATCLAIAKAKQEVTDVEADRLKALYDEYLEDAKAEGLSGADAEGRAGQYLRDEMETEAFEAQRRAFLTQLVRQNIWNEMQGYRNRKGETDAAEYLVDKMDGVGRLDTRVSLKTLQGTIYAIESQTLARLDAELRTFMGNISTKQRGSSRTLWRRVERELQGEATGDPVAKAHADALAAVLEDLRLRANAAGFNIPKLENWGWPSAFDMVRTRRMGRDNFVRLMARHGDRARMLHPSGRRGLTHGEFIRGLRHMYDTIVSAGEATRQPGERSRERFSTRHADARWFIFKDAAARRAVMDAVGDDDSFLHILQHMRSMASDIGMAEVFGPSPRSTFEWMKQLTRHEAGKADAAGGAAATLMPTHGRFAWTPEMAQLPFMKIRNFQEYARPAIARANEMFLRALGEIEPSRWWLADAATTYRNYKLATDLGGTFLTAATTDPVTRALNRSLFGLPVMRRFFTEYAPFMRGNNLRHRQAARQAGIALQTAMNALGGFARYAGDMGGSRWAAGLADRITWATFLKGVTQAGYDADGRLISLALGAERGKAWGDLKPGTRELLTAMRLNADDWEVARAAPTQVWPDGVEGVNAIEVARINRDVGERMLAGQWELARAGTLTAGPRQFSILSTRQPGSLKDILLRSFGYLGSFPVAMVQTHWYRAVELAYSRGTLSAMGYQATLLGMLTVAGVIAYQLGQFALNGRWENPYNEDGTINPEIALGLAGKGFLKGGGGGFWADFITAATNDDDRTLGERIGGPLVQDIGDIARVAHEGRKALSGEENRFAARAVALIDSNIPGNNAWYLRLAKDRILIDQFLALVDEDADADFQRQMNDRARNHPGTEYPWPEGQPWPSE